jgi:signal transduction histidine kinase
MEKVRQQERLRALVDAGLALASELSLDALLQRIIETAAELTGARYAALGVIGRNGESLERFLTYGVDEETRRAIGEPPHGRGILGVIIRDARTLRLADLTEDPRSVGVPPGHPPMRSFLGTPILLRGVAYGNLYLTEKEGGQFTEEDEELVQLLAAQAAVAIENARLYESATRWLRQLESLNEVSTALAAETDLPRLFQLVCDRLQELVDARGVAVALPLPDGSLRIAAAAGIDMADFTLGPDSKSARTLRRRRSERVDSVLDDPEVDREFARRFALHAGVWVPMLLRDRAIGLVLAVDKRGPDPRFTEEDVRLAESFAQRAAVAVDLSERVQRDSLRRVVEGQELERRRLARELHDETGQALTSILLGLRTIEEAAGDPEEVRRAVAEVRDLVVTTLQGVRRLAVELRPTALDDFGLVAALERLAQNLDEASDLRVDVEARLADGRLPSELETAIYRIVQEALTNVVKHADARHVSVVIQEKTDTVSVVIEDDGRGFEPAHARAEGLGLVGMRERAGLLGGTLTIESARGAGTTIALEVPMR